MMLTADQLDLHKSAIGGSMAPIVAGQSLRMQPLDLYHTMRGDIPEPPRTHSDDMMAWLGHCIEPVSLKWLESRLKQSNDLESHEIRASAATRYHRRHKWMIGHFDGKVHKAPIGVEAKLRFSAEGWGPDGSSEIPPDVLIQVTHYQAITGWRWIVVVFFLSSAEFRCYEIERDRPFERDIVEIERAFMDRLERRDPPPMDPDHPGALELLSRLYPGTNGLAVELPEETIHWHEVLVEAKAAMKRYKAVADGARAHIEAQMGEAAIGYLANNLGAYTRRRINRSAYTAEASSYMDFRHRKEVRPA